MWFLRLPAIALLLMPPAAAVGQGTVLQSGPTTPGHLPVYTSQGTFQPIIQDSGISLGASTLPISSVALLRASNISNQYAYLLGYRSPGDGGQGSLVYTPTDTTSIDNGCTIYVDAAGHRFYRTQNIVDLKQCGAWGDGTTDDASFLNTWWTACVGPSVNNVGHLCHIPNSPTGYRIGSSVIWDFAKNPGNGLHVYGDGAHSSLLEFDSGFNLTIECSTDCGYFYGAFDNFGVLGTIAGPAFQWGKAARTDAMNGFTFKNIWVQNLNATSAAVGVQLNSVFASVVTALTVNNACPDAQGNCAGYGDAFQMRQAAFNSINVAAGHAENAIRLTSGFVFANVFPSNDLEVSTHDVMIDSASTAGNMWQGGQFVTYADFGGSNAPNIYSVAPVSAQAENVFYSPNINVANLNSSALVGVHIVNQRYSNVTTPAFPASGTPVTNKTGRRILVVVYNGAPTTVCFGTTGTTCVTPIAGAPVSYLFNPGDVTIITYSALPGWVWTIGD